MTATILDQPSEFIIENTRTMNASQENVYRAWTEPEHLKNWWGPNGFTNTFHLFEPKPNGRWSFIMHGPDGKNYPNESIFLKLEKPKFIAFDHLSDPKFQIQASFELIDSNKTKVIFKMVFEDLELCKKLRDFVTEKNEENMDRLEEVLKKIN